MNMKRAVVEFSFEGSLEFEVPCGSSEAAIDRLARKAVLENMQRKRPEVGELAVCNVVAVERDEGGF